MLMQLQAIKHLKQERKLFCKIKNEMNFSESPQRIKYQVEISLGLRMTLNIRTDLHSYRERSKNERYWSRNPA
jgi:hypothetical protein